MQTRSMRMAFAVLALAAPVSALAAPADDQAMARSIAAGLRESGQLSNYRVGVKYQDGTAWLLGTVTSKEQATTAVELAERMQGVSKVVSKLEVVGGQTEAPVAKKPAQLKTDGPVAEETGSLLLAIEEDAPQAAPASLETPASPRQMSRPQGVAQQMQPPQPMGPATLQKPGQMRPAPQRIARRTMPMPMARTAPAGQPQQYAGQGGVQPAQACVDGGYAGGPMPQGYSGGAGAAAGAAMSYDNAQMPGYAWPSYAAYPNYAAVSYPQQYSPTAWPYIGPFYPYPQVPLGWRKVTLEWDDGWWFLDFSHCQSH